MCEMHGRWHAGPPPPPPEGHHGFCPECGCGLPHEGGRGGFMLMRGFCGCGCHRPHGPMGMGPWGGPPHGECRCGEEGDLFFRRHFRTHAEKLQKLEAYLRELEAEAQGVRELLEKLRQGPPQQPPAEV